MSEETVISKTDRPVTVNAICQGLIGVGIEPGDTLLVHSSLSSLGWDTTLALVFTLRKH